MTNYHIFSPFFHIYSSLSFIHITSLSCTLSVFHRALFFKGPSYSALSEAPWQVKPSAEWDRQSPALRHWHWVDPHSEDTEGKGSNKHKSCQSCYGHKVCCNHAPNQGQPRTNRNPMISTITLFPNCRHERHNPSLSVLQHDKNKKSKSNPCEVKIAIFHVYKFLFIKLSVVQAERV